MSTARTVLNILQDHYPERLGVSVIINIPFLINTFFKIVMPFVDPITRQKVKFNPDVYQEGIFTPENMMKQWWNGEQDFEYEHEKYWPALNDLCESRIKVWKENWRELGANVGLSEWEYKKGGELAKEVGGEEAEEKEKDTALDTSVPGPMPNEKKDVPSDVQEPLKEKTDEPTSVTTTTTTSAVAGTTGAGAVSGAAGDSAADAGADGAAE